MATTPQHTYQVLTKRPERMQALLSDTERFPVQPKVWLGASVEDSAVLARIDDLRATPAAMRFMSFEPLIGAGRGPDQYRLGYRWRRKRPWRAAYAGKVGAADPQSLPGSGRRILLQTMGRCEQEGRRATAARQDL